MHSQKKGDPQARNQFVRVYGPFSMKGVVIKQQIAY